ncbi:hypothetical protein [Rhodoferax sp.]|uniref:hypothetical protein n=1 Tax=Rhodoferax sp. TaxID=50421 RepID=UPI00374DAE0D
MAVKPMSPEKQTLLLIRGALYELPKDDRARIEDVAQQLRDLVKVAGAAHGGFALALVGAEAAAEE